MTVKRILVDVHVQLLGLLRLISLMVLAYGAYGDLDPAEFAYWVLGGGGGGNRPFGVSRCNSF